MSTSVTIKKITELVPYENNPRNNAHSVDAVANSIEQFGFKVPIVIDKDNVIVAGHTRYLACQKLGIEDVPCIVADDLTDEQIKAFRLVDNKTNELASWDMTKLDEELSQIDLDMMQFGFEDVEDIDLDSFFIPNEGEKKEKEPKQVQCPECGKWFTV